MLPIGWPQRQAASVVRSYDRNVDYCVPAAEVEKLKTHVTPPRERPSVMHSSVLEDVDTLLAQPHHTDDHSHNDGAKTTMGFWIYLMSDCLIFAVMFATFGVLMNQTAGGPCGKDLFELPFALGETMLLLISSFTFGMAMLNVQAASKAGLCSG